MTRAAALAILLAAAPASAQVRVPCLPDGAQLTADLASKYREVPRGMGLGSRGRAWALYVSPDGETWTIVARQPNGRTCIFGSGKAWQDIPAAPEGEAS